MRRFFALSLAFSLLTLSMYSQSPSQKEEIRIQIWAELDAFPGHFEEDGQSQKEGETASTIISTSDSSKNVKSSTAKSNAQEEADSNTNSFTASAKARDISMFSYAIARAKEIGPFLMGGMIDGWTFDYVPYDKTRQVKEIFEFEPIKEFNSEINTIIYNDPIPRDDRLVCWATCKRTKMQQLSYERWTSITRQKIHGTGKASVEKGFEGIEEACSLAIKEAVRSYWRSQIKNKPKEISGKVLLTGSPRIYICSGQYVVDLDFFLETDRIILYSFY